MHNRWLTTMSLAAALALPAVLSAQAATTICKDGTTSDASGKGACSSHGGVDKDKTEAAAKAVASPTTASPKTSTTAAADEVKCTDGTMSKAGKGACSHHGGMAKSGAAAAAPAAQAAAPAAAPAPAAAAAPAPAPAPKATASKTSTASSSTGPNTNAAGATAKCKDGTYSHSTHHTGTCSDHGGVAEWLDGTKPKS